MIINSHIGPNMQSKASYLLVLMYFNLLIVDLQMFLIFSPIFRKRQIKFYPYLSVN